MPVDYSCVFGNVSLTIGMLGSVSIFRKLRCDWMTYDDEILRTVPIMLWLVHV